MLGASKRRRNERNDDVLIGTKRFAPPAARRRRTASSVNNTHTRCFHAASVAVGSRVSQHALDLLTRLIRSDDDDDDHDDNNHDDRALKVLQACLFRRTTVLLGVEYSNQAGGKAAATNNGNNGTNSAPSTPLREAPLSAPSSPSTTHGSNGNAAHDDTDTNSNRPSDAKESAEATTSTSTATAAERIVSSSDQARTVFLRMPRDSATQAPVRRLREWVNTAPRLYDVLLLLAERLATHDCRTPTMRVLVGALLSSAARGDTASAVVELQRLALLLRQLGWLDGAMASAVESLSEQQSTLDDARRLLHHMQQSVVEQSSDTARHWLGASLLDNTERNWPTALRFLTSKNQ